MSSARLYRANFSSLASASTFHGPCRSDTVHGVLIALSYCQYKGVCRGTGLPAKIGRKLAPSSGRSAGGLTPAIAHSVGRMSTPQIGSVQICPGLVLPG